MSIPMGLTFDDITLEPCYSEILPSDTDISVQLTPDILLQVPILSSAMDTVTESEMAIAMAREGGLGVIHKNMSVNNQVAMVESVKRHSGGVVENPVFVRPYHQLSYVKELIAKTGYKSFPVVDTNRYNDDSKFLIGLITSRDIQFQRDDNIAVENFMTPLSKLIIATDNMDKDTMVELMYTHKIERIPVVHKTRDGSILLKGLFNLKDHQLKESFPNATRDEDGRLRVAAAVGPYSEVNLCRVSALAAIGVDAIVVDTAHGHSKGVVDMVKWIRKEYPKLSIIAGNVVTYRGTKCLFDAGANSVKVGIGSGSICTTRIVTGIGVPQYSAVYETAQAIEDDSQTIICDGGIRYSGDIVKAFVVGTNAVMLGGLLAGCDESPGKLEVYMGRTYKSYRGMGSLGAMMERYGSSDRYGQTDITPDKLVPEGIEGRVPCSGSVQYVLTQLIGGLRSGMGYLGCKKLEDMCQVGDVEHTVSPHGLKESHPHDVSIVREAPNYTLK